LASPKVILLLGEEVTSVVMKVSLNDANKLLQTGIQPIMIRGKAFNVIASPHPGILMRGGVAGEKWRRISEKQLIELKLFLANY